MVDGVGAVEEDVGVGVAGSERAPGTGRCQKEQRGKDGTEGLTCSADACNQARRQAENSHDGQ